MTFLHTLPTYRHPQTRTRVVVAPVPGSLLLTVDEFAPRAKTGRPVFCGDISEVTSWLIGHGYPLFVNGTRVGVV
jgi:hypothetical protein